MKPNENEVKRSRPLLGTFFTIALNASPDLAGKDSTSDLRALNSIFEAGFNEAARLEKMLSYFAEDSTLTRLNRARPHEPVSVEGEFLEILELSILIWQKSRAAFNPFLPEIFSIQSSPDRKSYQRSPYQTSQTKDGLQIQKTLAAAMDLGGIAKGYIVDRVTENILAINPSAAGSINGGGDLRYFNFNSEQRSVILRMGDPQNPILRTLNLDKACVATSSPSITELSEQSSSVYPMNLRPGLTPLDTVSVLADRCAIADALTKVALYADLHTTQDCAHHFGATILIFDSQGSLVETYTDVSQK